MRESFLFRYSAIPSFHIPGFTVSPRGKFTLSFYHALTGNNTISELLVDKKTSWDTWKMAT